MLFTELLYTFSYVIRKMCVFSFYTPKKKKMLTSVNKVIKRHKGYGVYIIILDFIAT